MRLPFEVFVALRYLRFHRGRTFLSVISSISVAGVAVGTASLVIALALNAGFVQDVRERIRSGSAHLTVLSADGADLFEDAGRLIDRLGSAPGVEAASPVVYTPALVSYERLGTHGFAEVYGIDPAPHAEVAFGTTSDSPFAMLDGETANGRAGIVLGEQLAEKIGAFHGDTVRVLVPRPTLAPWGPQPISRVYEVVGTYRSDHFQEDAIRAYIALGEARGLLRAGGGSSWVEVRTDDLRRLDETKQTLRQALGAEWIVVDLIDQNRDLLRALRMEKLILFLAIGLIVVVAALNIVSTLILMVNDKFKEIGTFTALGAKPVGIARIFVLQGAIIGVSGTLVGLAIGVGVCRLLDRFELIRLNPDVYYLDHIPFSVQSTDLLFVTLVTLSISFLATVYPAWTAARLDPVEALRYE